MKIGDKCRVLQNLSGASSPERQKSLARKGDVLVIVHINEKVGWYDEKHNPYTGEAHFYAADGYLQYIPLKDLELCV